MADNFSQCYLEVDLEEQSYEVLRFAIKTFEGICISMGSILMLFTILQFLFFDKLNTVFIMIQSQVSLFFIKMQLIRTCFNLYLIFFISSGLFTFGIKFIQYGNWIFNFSMPIFRHKEFQIIQTNLCVAISFSIVPDHFYFFVESLGSISYLSFDCKGMYLSTQ